MSEHGRVTHVGKCQRKARLRLQQSEFLPESREQALPPQIAEEASAPPDLPPDLPLGFPTEPDEERSPLQQEVPADKEWLKFWCGRGDVRMSLLEDVLQLAKLGPPSFGTAKKMMARIDALPGPSFAATAIKIADVETPYILRHRNVLEIAEALVHRFNGAFCDPAAENKGEFIAGERFRDLDRKLRAAAEPGAVLMPLVLSSGSSFTFRASLSVPCAV